ncbi:acyl-CoA-binding protein [Mucilaginibacter mali]|uniref:Acyl-CoA-binding protein n=1 Tax=Mucilaginibacter mali TaxID=2740462 RepID=A0A7D4UA13_9SPHI|nr:acyl-CoA-binding protein [Mucilaginibacter mali]QKJ29518.1 acyl-CoA-binding protein [Mucilaginibacter mali]
MSNLKENFEQAVKESKELSKRPDNETLLKLYSLYKQATDGDMPDDTEKPKMFDFVAQAKYDAWKNRKGTSGDEAMQAYVDLVTALKEK